MSIVTHTRLSDADCVETITGGVTLKAGHLIRPAETHWHMVISRRADKTEFVLVGPWSTSGLVDYDADAEILWIRLKMGVYMSHLPTQQLRDSETILPDATGDKIWLRGDTWQLPDYENADTFITQLIRDGTLCYDPAIASVLRGHAVEVSARTLRHRFLRRAGLSQKRIYQIQRAQHAQMLLQQGYSILDTVYAADYYDQSHLTRCLKQYIGYTPSQIQSHPK